MLRCPERHEEGFLVLSTGEMLGRMVRSGVLACPKCGREYAVLTGVVQSSGSRQPGAACGAAPSTTATRSPLAAPVDAHIPHTLLDLSIQGSYMLFRRSVMIR